MSEGNNGSVIAGMIWMFIISLLLFWLPVVGALIAGIVGGKKAGGVMAGFTAAILPGLIFGGLLYFLASMMTGLPIIAAIAAMGGLVLALLHIGPLLLGALIGGLLA